MSRWGEMKPVIRVGVIRRAVSAASRLLAVLVRVVVPWRAGRDFFRRESGFMGGARSSGDAGVGMWLVGLSAGWVGAGGGGWGMRRMDAGVGRFPIIGRLPSVRHGR